MDFPFALCHDIEVFFTYSTFFRCRSVTCAISRFQNAPFKTKTIKICAPFESYCQCNGIEREWKKLHLVCMTTCAFMVVHVNKFMWQSLYIHSTLSNTLSLLGKKRVLSYHKMQFEYAFESGIRCALQNDIGNGVVSTRDKQKQRRKKHNTIELLG